MQVLHFGSYKEANAIITKYNLDFIDLADITGYDIEEKDKRIRYSKIAGVSLPYLDNSFDLINVYKIIHHIKPHLFYHFLDELYRCCRKWLVICDFSAGLIYDDGTPEALDIAHGDICRYKDKTYYRKHEEIKRLLEGKFKCVGYKIDYTFKYISVYEKIEYNNPI
jgi:hypothetical protein